MPLLVEALPAMSSMSNDLNPEKPRRILLIEDSELDRLWLRHRLKSDCLEVVEAVDGLTGLDLCRADPPDLILLDLGLPFCDGFEVLRRLKNDRRTIGIPVIVVSASSDTSDKARGLDLGAIDFISKPYDLIELQARVRAALRSKRLQELLEQRAHVDALTGLANRASLEERLSTEWAIFQRYGGALAVVIADLDHFKKVNDAHGHAAGDEVLRRTADALRATVRTTDLAARFGGEEFVIVAPHCNTAGAVKTAERFRHRLASAPLPQAKGAGRVTSSVGVASVPEDKVGSAAELLSWADRALYEAKARGRDRVICCADLPADGNDHGAGGPDHPAARP